MSGSGRPTQLICLSDIYLSFMQHKNTKDICSYMSRGLVTNVHQFTASKFLVLEFFVIARPWKSNSERWQDQEWGFTLRGGLRMVPPSNLLPNELFDASSS